MINEFKKTNNEQSLREILEQSADITLLVNTEGVCIESFGSSFNHAFWRNINKGTCLSQALDQSNFTKTVEAINYVIDYSTVDSIEYEIQKNNCTFFFQAKIRKFNSLSAIMSIRDISEIKAYEQKLKSSETQLHSLIQNIPTATAMFDHSLRYITCSDKWLSDYKLDRESIISKFHHDVFPYDYERWQKIFKVCLKGKSLHANKESFTFPNDTKEWLRWDVRPWRKNNKIAGIIVTTESLTEQVILEEQLEVERLRAHNSAKMAELGQIASRIAHEINNPLAVIQGTAYQINLTISKPDFEPSEITRLTDKIENTTQRITKIITGLKTYARDGSNDPFESTSLQKIFSDTIDLCEQRTRDLDIQTEWPDPIILQESYIECRAVQIVQVLVNLINNSCDAIYSLPEKWIKVQYQESNQAIAISVVDSGQGIPEDVADKILNPFFTTKPIGKGTGLGLSIAHGIAQSHHGNFFLDQKSTNTKFTITLPKRQPKKGHKEAA